MSNINYYFLFLLSSHILLLQNGTVLAHRRNLLQNGTVSAPCPLNFEILRRFATGSIRRNRNPGSECQYVRQGLRLVQSDYLQRTNSFLPPLDSAESCWDSFELLINDYIRNFEIRRTCGFRTEWIATGCMNITTRAQFESIVPQSVLDDVVTACNQTLINGSPCASCTTALSNLQAPYLSGNSIGNVSDCTAYPFIYAGAFVNHFGPTDEGTAKCLFNLNLALSGSNDKGKNKTVIVIVVVVVFVFLLILALLGFWFNSRRKGKKKLKNSTTSNVNSGLDSMSASTNLKSYTFDEVKASTKNFSRENLIGKGGYGNVYKGVLPNGSEVALKRFKNCSAAGDASFTHEVEVIASVRHVNLVALRGYCTATTPREGHQRIIVCDLMNNGSVHDHLFGSVDTKLSWPIRQKIALGTARGLAYLHHGAQHTVIHRDIKASNILLDEDFEPKVADFGLAKFTPEGKTHLSTKVAGTIGYVAPEYALYGQLTERSDVYSFGVVLLEVLSGKKALIAGNEDQQPTLLADWAWELVRKGEAMAVVEENMPDLGPVEVVEKYVLVAVLCSHPQLYARPTMDQVVKMLDMDVPIPSIPERPISILSNRDDIERSVSCSSSGSGQLSTASGYQNFT